MATSKENIPLAFREAREKFREIVSEIEFRIIGPEPVSASLAQAKEVERLQKFVIQAVNKLKDTSKDKDLELEVDLIPSMKEVEWQKLFTALSDMNVQAYNFEAIRIMRIEMEKSVRKFCGKMKSKRTVEQILIKAAKVHKLPIFAQKFIQLIHPHFCITLDNQIEYYLLPISEEDEVGKPIAMCTNAHLKQSKN